MLKRVAKVIWWLGFLLVLVTMFGLYSEFVKRKDCDQLITLGTVMDAAHEKLTKSYIKEHNPGAELSKLPWEVRLGADLAVEKDPRDTPAFRESLAYCQSSVHYGIAVILIATVVLWSVAFVLGGSFWTPPKIVG